MAITSREALRGAVSVLIGFEVLERLLGYPDSDHFDGALSASDLDFGRLLFLESPYR